MTQVPATQTENGIVPTTAPNPFVTKIMERVYATGRYVGGFGIMGQALTADTLEEALNIGEVVSAEDHLNARIRFKDVQFADSDPELESRIPIFAVMKVVVGDGTGVVRTMTCGAEHVLSVLIRACELDWYPFEGQLQSKELGKGKAAINLVPVPARVANTAAQ